MEGVPREGAGEGGSESDRAKYEERSVCWRRQTARVASAPWGPGVPGNIVNSLGPLSQALSSRQRLLGSEGGRRRPPRERSRWAQRLRGGKGHPHSGEGQYICL